MKIAVFGGSFDPPHNGHFAVAKSILVQINPDILYIIPAYRSPLKRECEAEARHRLAMCRLCFNTLPKVTVSDMEIISGGSSYTCLTVKRLKEAHPDSEIYLTVGADQLLQLEKWVNYPYLLENCTVLAAPRNGAEAEALTEKALSLGAKIRLLHMPSTPESSAEARKGNTSLLPQNVREYIKLHGLYRGAHIQGVAKIAEIIRQDYFPALTPEQVENAALLHDCTKGDNQTELCEKYGLELSESAKRSPAVLHAFTGAVKQRAEGADDGTVDAIAYHTTGKPKMPPLTQIIFVADYIEENRKYTECISAREYYFAHRGEEGLLDRLTLTILESTLNHLKKQGGEIHPLTLRAAEYYREITKGK